MKTKIITVLSLMLLLILLSGIASAQTVTVGLSKGETFDYSYTLIWKSTNPSATIPTIYADANETTNIQVKIIEISGSKISIELTTSFRNGTQDVQTGNVDIKTASINIPYGYLIVRSNINANEAIYPAGGNQMITSTFTKSYLTGERETNQVISTLSSDTMTINYDKIKGVAVDYSMQMVQTADGYVTTITETLVNTNSDVWAVAQPTPSVPEFFLLVVPVVLAAVSALLLVAKNTKRLPLKL